MSVTVSRKESLVEIGREKFHITAQISVRNARLLKRILSLSLSLQHQINELPRGEFSLDGTKGAQYKREREEREKGKSTDRERESKKTARKRMCELIYKSA